METMYNESDIQNYEGVGIQLVGSLAEMIDLMIPGTEERIWVTNQLNNEGSIHTQVLNAIMIKRLLNLIKTIQIISGTNFILQVGYELTNKSDNKETLLPITLPINIGPEKDNKKIAEAISEAPDNEVLTYAICIQAIEWAIKATTKNNDF